MKKYKVMFCKYETIEVEAKTESEAIDEAIKILNIACPSMKRYDEVEVEEEDGETTNDK